MIERTPNNLETPGSDGRRSRGTHGTPLETIRALSHQADEPLLVAGQPPLQPANYVTVMGGIRGPRRSAKTYGRGEVPLDHRGRE